jgi:hypothetical protein
MPAWEIAHSGEEGGVIGDFDGGWGLVGKMTGRLRYGGEKEGG